MLRKHGLYTSGSRLDAFRHVPRVSFGGKGSHRDRQLSPPRAIRQERGGHISPPAAYDADTDRFLILDLSVTNISHLPVWVAAEDLFFTMNTTDPDNKRKIGVRTDP